MDKRRGVYTHVLYANMVQVQVQKFSTVSLVKLIPVGFSSMWEFESLTSEFFPSPLNANRSTYTTMTMGGGAKYSVFHLPDQDYGS